MSDSVPDHFCPRLCRIVKSPNFEGYGFNLHAEKGKAGQFIGQVEESSPAEAADLRLGDRIVEVNGVNIGNENHQQVVTRIKSGGEEVRLLVVDVETDNWYKTQKKVVRGDLPEVRFISSERDDDNFPGHKQVIDNHHQIHEHSLSEPEVVGEKTNSGVFTSAGYGNGINEDDSHRPRRCHLKIWPHFQGYGFTLNAEKNKPGQFIGQVDDSSPASTGGLRVYDRIIEINDVNVEKETHTEVISRIKAVPGETVILVVDKETDKYYKEKGVTVSSSMPQTDHIVTPDFVGTGTLNGPKPSPPPSEADHEFTVAPAAYHHSSTAQASKGTDGLELNLSVAEMKERLKAKKKQDPRQTKVPFGDKYKEFQKM